MKNCFIRNITLLLLLTGLVSAAAAQDYLFTGDASLTFDAAYVDPGDDDDEYHTADTLLQLKSDHTLSFDWGEAILRHRMDITSDTAGEQDLEYQLFQASVSYWAGDALTLRVGRHTIAWGMGYAFYPGDKLHPERTPKGDYAGFDGASATLILSPDWTMTGAVRVDRMLSAENLWWKEARGALIFSGYVLGVDLMAGCVGDYEDVLRPGAGFSVDLAGLILTAEAAAEFWPDQGVYYPTEDEDDLLEPIKLNTKPVWQPLYSATVGLQRTFYLGDHSLTLMTEYFYTQEGFTQTEANLLYDETENLFMAYALEAGYSLADLADVTEEDLANKFPAYMGQHYLFPRLAWDWNGQAGMEHYALINLQDRSALISHSLNWNNQAGFELKLTGNWVYGTKDKTEMGLLNERISAQSQILIYF